jgi:nucleoside-diphosphate-sugar epimerase
VAASLVARVEPTHLLHLAWCTEPATYWESPQNARWLSASVDLLREFAAAGGVRAVVTGTCAEYDWSRAGEPLSECSTPLAPRGAYGRAKDALRGELERLSETAGLSAAWARLFFLFGPAEHPARLVPSVARALLDGHPAPCSSGHQVRDYLSSEAAGQGLAVLLDGAVQGPVNLGTGRATSVRELVELVAQAAGRPDLLRLGAVPARPDEPARIVADVTRWRSEVGWRVPDDLAPAIEATVDWWRRAG